MRRNIGVSIVLVTLSAFLLAETANAGWLKRRCHRKQCKPACCAPATPSCCGAVMPSTGRPATGTSAAQPITSNTQSILPTQPGASGSQSVNAEPPKDQCLFVGRILVANAQKKLIPTGRLKVRIGDPKGKGYFGKQGITVTTDKNGFFFIEGVSPGAGYLLEKVTTVNNKIYYSPDPVRAALISGTVNRLAYCEWTVFQTNHNAAEMHTAEKSMLNWFVTNYPQSNWVPLVKKEIGKD